MSLLNSSEIELLRQNRPSPQEDHSTLSRLLNPWWEWAARRVPESIAPNTLTVAGSLALVLPTLVQIYLSPTLGGQQPWWACLGSLVGIFLFQTLDAIDGKQARRTKTSSPLGSWLDHALDILTIQFVFVGAAASMGMGVNAVFSFVIGTVLLNSYMLHWEVHHTRLLYLGNGTSIAEAQLLCMAIHLTSAVLGTSFWQQTVPVIGLRYGDLLVSVAVIGVGWSGMIFSILRARKSGAGWTSLTQARGQLVLVALLAVASATISDHVMLFMYILGISMLGSRLISDLVLHNLLDREPAIIQWPTAILAIFIGSHVIASSGEIPANYLLAMATLCLGFCTIVTIGRMTTIARALAVALGIRIFTIR